MSETPERPAAEAAAKPPEPAQPAETQPAEAQPAEAEAQPAQTPAAETQPADPKPAEAAAAAEKPSAKDAPITGEVLRKAASSPDELLEIMREEKKAQARKAKREETTPAKAAAATPTKPAAPTEPKPATPTKPAAQSEPKPVTPTQPAAQTEPKPVTPAKPSAQAPTEPKPATPPQPALPTKAQAAAATAAASPPKAQAVASAAQAKEAQATQAKARAQAQPAAAPPRPAYVPPPRAAYGDPSDTGVLPPLTPSGSGRILPGGAGAPRIVLPRPPVWPLVSAVGVVGVGLIVALVQVGHLLAGALRERALAPAVAGPAPQAWTPPPALSASEGQRQLASIGGGRVVESTPEGHLIVLRADPTSGELEVERAYELVNDPDRNLGDPGRRRWHGYYLDDLEVSRQLAVEAAVTEFERVVAAAVRFDAGLEAVEDAGTALARAGGADRLLPALASDGADRVEAVRKHGAAIGLGRAGYVGAVPGLLELLEQHPSSDRLVPLLVGILGRLTGLDLDPSEPHAALERARVWWGRQSPRDALRRVKGS